MYAILRDYYKGPFFIDVNPRWGRGGLQKLTEVDKGGGGGLLKLTSTLN